MNFENPETVEQVVMEEWCATLECDSTTASENFFDLGGNSIMAIEMIERLERRLDIEFPVDVLFGDGTRASVAEACVARCLVTDSTSGAVVNASKE